MYTAGQASALKNERTRSIPRASAGLLVHKPKTPSNSSLHLQSPVTKLARAGARASKSVNHLESLISIFFLKKKDIFKSPYDVLSRNKNRLNDSSWRIYVYWSLGCFYLWDGHICLPIWCFNKHVMNFKSYYFWQKDFLASYIVFQRHRNRKWIPCPFHM